MVHVWQSLNFSSLMDEFFATRPLRGPHAKALQSLVHTRTSDLLNHPDVRYMPTFKVLELLANIANITQAIDEESQLYEHEARAMLHQALSDEASLIHHFLLEASLERARYEPMMILDTAGHTLRDHTLRKRWTAMRYAHQRHTKLPASWLTIVDEAVAAAIAAPCFLNFRVGPLMQLFAEMLNTARRLYEEKATPEMLAHALAESGTLWKRYALKPKRYSHKPASPHLADFTARSTLH